MTQPTLGFGALCPRASSPSRSASPIHLRSSVNMKLLGKFLEFALALLLRCLLVRHILFLVGDNLRVRPVRRVEFDLDNLGWRGGSDLCVDEKFDHNDCRNQE